MSEASDADWMVMVAEPEAEPEVATTAMVPAALEVRKPLVTPESLTVAFDGSETLQWAEAVTVCWVPSLRVAVAANCWV